jgi:hypothetical protein
MSDVFQALSSYRPTRALIPNLRSINFSLIMPAAYPWAHALLGPRIEEVTISEPSIEDTTIFEGPIEESQLTTLCASILSQSPCLSRLHIKLWYHSPAISRLVCGLHHLRFVKFSGAKHVTKQVGYHLANLPDLIHLETDGYLTTTDVYTTAGGQFPSLKEVFFPVTEWTTSATFMDSMQCCLTTLNMNKYYSIGIPETVSCVAAFTRSMHGHPSLSSLTHLNLWDRKLIEVGSDHESSAHEVLRPLFSLSALEDLSLSFPFLKDLNDSWLSDAAAAWPSLEHICVHSVVSKMTLTGLVPLIKKCPQLQSLSLSLDAKPVKPALLDGVYNINICRLSFYGSTISSPLQVFRSLIRMFPNLQSVDYEIPYCWREVNRLLRDSSYTEST